MRCLLLTVRADHGANVVVAKPVCAIVFVRCAHAKRRQLGKTPPHRIANVVYDEHHGTKMRGIVARERQHSTSRHFRQPLHVVQHNCHAYTPHVHTLACRANPPEELMRVVGFHRVEYHRLKLHRTKQEGAPHCLATPHRAVKNKRCMRSLCEMRTHLTPHTRVGQAS